MGWQALRYGSAMEWAPASIRALREQGLCLPQDRFATILGFTKRTVGNAERAEHPPSLALRQALDNAVSQASDLQRNRFLEAVATEGNNPPEPRCSPHPRSNPSSYSAVPRRLISAGHGGATLARRKSHAERAPRTLRGGRLAERPAG
jgi:DNA-binding XRE family transcriptional regulator